MKNRTILSWTWLMGLMVAFTIDQAMCSSSNLEAVQPTESSGQKKLDKGLESGYGNRLANVDEQEGGVSAVNDSIIAVVEPGTSYLNASTFDSFDNDAGNETTSGEAKESETYLDVVTATKELPESLPKGKCNSQDPETEETRVIPKPPELPVVYQTPESLNSDVYIGNVPFGLPVPGWTGQGDLFMPSPWYPHLEPKPVTQRVPQTNEEGTGGYALLPEAATGFYVVRRPQQQQQEQPQRQNGGWKSNKPSGSLRRKFPFLPPPPPPPLLNESPGWYGQTLVDASGYASPLNRNPLIHPSSLHPHQHFHPQPEQRQSAPYHGPVNVQTKYWTHFLPVVYSPIVSSTARSQQGYAPNIHHRLNI